MTDPIGTLIEASGCRFEVVGHTTNKAGQAVHDVKFLGPATGKAAKSKGVTVKPPMPPANVTASPTVGQMLVAPKPATPKPHRCHRCRSRFPVRLRQDRQPEPNIGGWLLGIFLALIACGFMGDCQRKAHFARAAQAVRGAR